jgi:DNA-binding transcriptional regulator GbsR (MarR family)
MQKITNNPSSFEAVLGTPTAQKIVKLLVTWDSLSIQNLVSKSHISKSQVHITLKNLISQSIVFSPSRGNYTLPESPFMKSFKKTYLIKIIELINSEIYIIKQFLKDDKLEQAEKKFSEMVEQYDPILQKSFSSMLSSLSSRFIEKLAER